MYFSVNTSYKIIMQKRNLNLDIIRCVALIYILCVHYFLNANFYYSGPVSTIDMKLGVILRNCFAACVPLFLILTGYLMNHKKLSAKFYMGLSKVLILYGLSCIPIWIFQTLEQGYNYDVYTLFRSFVGFELYAWYVGLYVCLYLCIPFLNIMYHQLETKQNKLILIGVLVLLTAMPSLFNKFGINLIPTFFEEFYPLTYYFIGAFLSEYADDFKLSAVAAFILYFIVIIVGGSYVNVWVDGHLYYNISFFVDWGNLLNTCSAPLLFLAFLKCDFSKTPKPIAKFIETLSLVSLQLYIVSYIFDIIVYQDFNAKYPLFADRLIRLPLPIIQVFIPSFLIALMIHFIYTGIKKISTR